jgi:hypothetical protein
MVSPVSASMKSSSASATTPLPSPLLALSALANISNRVGTPAAGSSVSTWSSS